MIEQSRFGFIKYEGPFLKSFTALPSPELRGCIEKYVGQEFDLSAYPGKYMPSVMLLPSERILMSFCYHDTSYLIEDGSRRFRFNTLVMGEHSLQTQYCVGDIPKVNKQMFAVFRPGGFFRLFNIYDGEVRNVCIKSDEIVGAHIMQIKETMDNAATIEERVCILDRYFLHKLNCRRGIMSSDDTANAVRLMAANKGRLKIEEVSREMTVSKRTLERGFMDRIGLSPKEFSKVVRFKNVLNAIYPINSVDWQDLVVSYGYFDQSHLIDDFKAATTFTPESFMKQKGKSIILFGREALILTKPLETQHESYKGFMKEIEEFGEARYSE